MINILKFFNGVFLLFYAIYCIKSGKKNTDSLKTTYTALGILGIFMLLAIILAITDNYQIIDDIVKVVVIINFIFVVVTIFKIIKENRK